MSAAGRIYVESPRNELVALFNLLNGEPDPWAPEAILNFMEAAALALVDPDGADTGGYPLTVVFDGIPAPLAALIVDAAHRPAENHEATFRELMRVPHKIVLTATGARI